MTKREQLQAIADEGVRMNPDCYSFTVEWRGRGGWWAVPDERRHFNDKGEFLGNDFNQAQNTLAFLLA